MEEMITISLERYESFKNKIKESDEIINELRKGKNKIEFRIYNKNFLLSFTPRIADFYGEFLVPEESELNVILENLKDERDRYIEEIENFKKIALDEESNLKLRDYYLERIKKEINQIYFFSDKKKAEIIKLLKEI